MNFEAHYCYTSDEPYNAGRGLSALDLTAERANILFEVFEQRRENGENYALEIRDGTKLVRAAGPSMAEASRSMNAAYARRRWAQS